MGIPAATASRNSGVRSPPGNAAAAAAAASGPEAWVVDHKVTPAIVMAGSRHARRESEGVRESQRYHSTKRPGDARYIIASDLFMTRRVARAMAANHFMSRDERQNHHANKSCAAAHTRRRRLSNQ